MQVSEITHVQAPHRKSTQDHWNHRPYISKAEKRTRTERSLLADLQQARASLGLSNRDLTVLRALLSFVHGSRVAGGQPIIVSPSNKALAERADYMPDNTLRRHLAALLESGLILRRDSPNGNATREKGREAKYMKRLISISAHS